MDEAVRCSVCAEVYREGQREPLVLPCGHAFCRRCLTNIYDTGHFTCPSCRRDLSHLDVQDLPQCFPLLSLSATYSEFQHEQCSLHGDDQTYWCRECEETFCSVCLYTRHPTGHHVLQAKTFLKDKKLSLNDEISQLDDVVESIGDDIKRGFYKGIKKVKQFCQLEEEVAALSSDVINATSVWSIQDCENKLKYIQNHHIDKFLDEATEGNVDAGERTAAAVAEAGMTQESSSLNQHHTHFATAYNVGDRDCAGLSSRDGRLLVHSLCRRLDSRLFLKLPSEVFLELSVGGRCLGRVYIQLWWHLRRAQQFLALCLGTLGPSYIGASFSHVAYMKKSRESLCCKEYRSADGKACTTELLVDLEWGGEFSRTPQEGLLIPLSKKPDEHGFGICTRGQHGGSFHCPFGEVTSGMRVVRAAIRHDPVTDVGISDCGIVLPDLTP